MTIIRILFLIVIAGLLVACGGGGTTTLPTLASPIINAAGGLGDPAGPAGQQFTVDITGQLALRLADLTFAVRFVQVDTAGLPAHQLVFEDPEAKVTVLVVFLGTTPPAAGTYPITLGAEENGVYALVIDRRGELQGSYTTIDGAGTITLTQDGANYGGSFEFKASGGMQDADPSSFLTATPVMLDLTVKGTFAGVPLQ
jgi:hypothetical protein